MDFQEIAPYKGKSRWFSREGEFYVACRTQGTCLNLRCASACCPVRWTVKTDLAGSIIGGSHNQTAHNHVPTPWVLNRNLLFQSLKRRAHDEHSSLKFIYEEEAARYPDGASHLLWESVVPSLMKWRRAAQPAVPANLTAYKVVLADHPRHRHMLLDAVSADNATAVILAEDSFASCLCNSNTIVVDGTFLPVLADLPAAQLLTLHGIEQGHVFHPVMVIMENKSMPLYEAVIRRVWVAAGHPTPQHVVTNYEPALQTALTSVTGVQAEGCLFNFTQALLVRARCVNGLDIIKNSPGWQLVQLYSALALLPVAQVPLALAEIQGIARQRNLPFSQNFHAYFERQWMIRVGPASFSAHRRPHRISNVAENFHATLRQSLGASPNIWSFTDVIAKKFDTCASRLTALRQGDPPRRNKERLYLRKTLLEKKLRALERGVITLRQFLVAISQRLDVGVETIFDDANFPVEEEEVEVEPEVVPPPIPVESPGPHRNQLECGVCLGNTEDTFAFVSCGHTICRDCLPQFQTGYCHVCRTPISGTPLRLYI